MDVAAKKLPRGQAELTVTLTADEYAPFLHRAAAVVSAHLTIPGFRAGKAPYEVMVEKIGEAKLWEEALEAAVKRTYPQALAQAKLESVGSPQIGITKLAPGNPVVYRATVNLLPEVQLSDLSRIKVERRAPTVADADVTKTLEDLRTMRRTEVLVTRPARAKDKVEIRLDTFHESVPVEHGQSERLPLVLGENRFLPGFEEQVIGLAANQEKAFPLKLPDDYHNRAVAGKTVEFRVKVLGVYELTPPELTDEFAKSLGKFASLSDLKEKLRASLLQEAAKREDDRLEGAVMDELIAKSKFSDIPDLLVTTETKTMAAELEHNVGNQGIGFDEYLASIKKDRAQLLLDLTPQAIKRVKGALISRLIAKQQQVTASDAEVDAAVAREFSAYEGNPEIRERTKSPEFRSYVENVLVSRKVMEYLKITITSL
ncbi:MAG: Trigger factor [Parcubacteria group bacterium Gr01-1014_31]|nr:MAG: Trigger factor [Parcubacteria group bacterium Gr01-1014_31]